MNYRSWFDVCEHPDLLEYKMYSCSGSMYVDEKVPQVNEDGTIDLIVSGKTNLYDYINSFKDSCDINRILQRYANGDVAALNKKVGQFFDAVEAPESLASAFNTIMAGEKLFTELPANIKEKFGSNFYNFLTKLGSPDFYEIFKDLKDPGDQSNKNVYEESEPMEVTDEP